MKWWKITIWWLSWGINDYSLAKRMAEMDEIPSPRWPDDYFGALLGLMATLITIAVVWFVVT